MPKQTDNTTPRSALRRTAAFIGRWMWRVFGTLLILGALFVVVAQTDMFRRWMRDRVIELANDQLIGKLAIDGARLDLFRGIVLDHPRLYAEGTTVFEAKELSITYDIAALFGKTIALGEVRIIQPHINLIRSKQGVWNFERIVKPPADTTKSELPDLFIATRAFIIEDGDLVVNDRTTKDESKNYFDPTHLHLSELKLHMSVRAALQDHDFAVAINGLSYRDHKGPTNVSNLTTVIRASKSGIDVQSLHIVTDKSDIWARARINDVDVVDGFSDTLFRAHPIIAKIEADKVWGPELHYFIPPVDLLDGYSLDADAVFDGNSIDVQNMKLEAGDGEINGSVRVSELDGGDKLELDVKVHDSHARYADVRRRIRFVPLPVLEFLGTTQMKSVHLHGHPSDSLWFDVDGKDRPGAFKGTMTLYLSRPTLAYDVEMNLASGDLSVFSNDPELQTNLNGRVMMVGSGLSLQDLSGTTQIELDRSRLFGRPVRSFRTIIKADGKGHINVDTMFADFTPFSDDTTKPDPFSDISSQRIGLHAVLDVSDTSHPKYSGEVTVNGLDVASLFDTPTLPSRLSWTTQFDVQGIEMDSIVGSINGRVFELALADRSIMPFALTASSKHDAGKREILVESDFAKARIDGAYNPSTLVAAIGASIEAVAHVITQRTKHLINQEVSRDPMQRTLEPVDADVSISVLDASMINAFVPEITLSGSADVNGKFVVNNDDINIKCDSIAVKDFALTTEGVELYSEPASASIAIEIENVSSRPHVSKFDVAVDCDSILRVNDERIYRPRVSLDDTNGVVTLRASGGVNDMRFGVAASGTIKESNIDLKLDTASFTLDARQGLKWRLIRPASIEISNGVYTVHDLLVQRPWAETINFSGSVSKDKFTDFSARLINFPLRDIPRFVRLEEGHPARYIDGLITDLTVFINGAWTSPKIDLKVDAVDVTYNEALIGALHADIKHELRSISGKVNVIDPRKSDSTNTLELNIAALPVDLAFADVEERLVSGKPVDMELNAKGLALAAVEPFLPAIERLHGKANATVTVKGTSPSDIRLGGSGYFKRARFLASSTNIEYEADGVLHLEDQTLYLDTITIRNIDRDLKGGIAKSSGVVVFDGLRVDSVDFVVTTPNETGIKVMSRASQARSPNIYGDFEILTGNKPIHFFGKLSAPKLKGEIIVKYAEITFPKERSSTKARQTSFTYLRTDTTYVKRKNIADYNRKQQKQIVDSLLKDTTKNDSTQKVLKTDFVEDVVRNFIQAATPSFSDLIYYDMEIYLRGRTLLTMIFGSIEMLIADLEQVDRNIPLTFTGKFANNSTTLRGVVRVKEGVSTYKFYKPFRTSGTLNFNTGGMTNPTLDLKATYEDSRTVSSGGDTKREDYKVELRITGTKQFPRIAYRIWRNGREVYGDSNKIAGDALMLILVGRTTDELYAEGQGNLVNEISAASSAVATNLLSDIIGSNGGIVQNTQVDVGSDISQTRLTVSGQIFGDVSYRVSGQISDFSGNSTFTLTLPFSVLGDEEALRYLQADFSSTVNNSGNITRQTRLWEIKLGARLP